MNTPDEQDPFAYDAHLRAHFEEAARTPPPLPPARIWANLQPHLQPRAAAPNPRRAPWLAGFAGLMVGMLLMWALAPTGPAFWSAEKATVRTSQAQAAPKKGGDLASDPKPVPYLGGARPYLGRVSGSDPKTSPYLGTASGSNPLAVGSDPLAVGSDPLAVGSDSLRLGSDPQTPVIPTVLLPLVGTEQTQVQWGADSALTARERRRDALLMQRAALVRLQLRTDSLLLALAPVAETGAVTAVDSLPVAKPKQRWSVLLTAAAERDFFGLNAPAADTLAALRTVHEQGRAGYNAALLAEYRLTDRWSVGAGIGTSAYGGELRLTDRKTSVKVDTIVSLVQTTRDTTFTTEAYSIRVVDELRLSPVVNFNNQIIGYDSVYVQRNDTVWTYLTTTTTVTTVNRKLTPKITTRDEVVSRVLRPSYHFLTLPVLVRYRFGRTTDWTSSPTAPRWWADVSAGAQLQWFMGGTQVTTTDGRSFATARIGRADGPFRPFNFALTSSVALNYALTQRLSASLAPTVRYQAQSVYKPATHLTQRPLATGVQLGLRYAF